MSFSQGYGFKVLLYIDLFASSLMFRDPDVTISSLCGLALKHPKPGIVEAMKRGVGTWLNWMVRGHTMHAIANDTDRAQRAIKILSGADQP